MYDKIIIHRHENPDGDALGSQIGLATLLRENYPKKKIFMVGDMSRRFAFMEGSEMDTIADEEYEGALAIVLDTSASHLISDKRYTLAKETVRMDHHLFCEKICGLEVVDTSFESCAGLVAEFARVTGLRQTSLSAKSLYTGMVTDSGRFRFRSVSGETLRLAGILLDVGVDIDTLYAQLYLKDFDSLKLESYVYEKMQMTESGVAYIYVDRAMQERFGLTQEEASAVVSHLENIRGSLIWIAFIDNKDGSIRVRLRSRFVTVNELASKYHGGGHDCASGATCYSQEEMQALIADAEALHAKYKAENEGWL